MKTIQYIKSSVIPAAYNLLPSQMNSPAATQMLLAIGLQESNFNHRVQLGGPAHGFWQFERLGGVAGVLRHSETKDIAVDICHSLVIPTDSTYVYTAIVYNDILACVFARLLLWTLPGALPKLNEEKLGWMQYLDAWRPGLPHPESWYSCWNQALRT